jgi:MoaA/NifB/PqqE/SkfB family radical SAM enzyme
MGVGMDVGSMSALKPPSPSLDLLFLEITGKCQLACVHCYADSGPLRTHGTMTLADWDRVIAEAADIGVPKVQFTGGEPTTHPDLPSLVRRALSRRLEVEVYTNLVQVTPEIWEVFSLSGVRIGTSYYSDARDQHKAITGRRHSHGSTTAAITTAIERGIPIRVGLIDVNGAQRVQEATTMLTDLGVRDIYVDRVRHLGRARTRREPDITQLCGTCAGNLLAIQCDGTVTPCPISRWMTVGSIRHEGLRTILAGRKLRESRTRIRKSYGPHSPQELVNARCAPP